MEGTNEQAGKATDFLLEESEDTVEQGARLVHGTLSHIIAFAASNSDVSVSPRPTVLYKGSRITGQCFTLHMKYPL